MSTLVYPQLASGALSQYPITKTRRPRTVINEAADGTTVRLSDPGGESTEWRLEYAEIDDQEAAALEAFFVAAEGSLNGFTFLDPTGNLLASSDRLDADAWQQDPQLTLSGGVADAAGGTGAWRLQNAGAADQGVSQTLQSPGEYTYCLSVYARSAVPATLRLTIGAHTADRAIGEQWGRVVFTAAGTAGEHAVRFGIGAAAGTTVEVYGPQAEAQSGASVYRTSGRGGVYEDAHFRDDTFAVTRTGFNRNSCTVNIIHANHL